jgi:hypothetical protein
MTANRIFLTPLLAILLLTISPVNAGEEGTVQATIPWEGEGRVFRVNTSTLVFLGSLTGIIYVEDAKGEMNEGFVVCPILQKLDLKSGKTDAKGHCEISASPDNVLYAKLSCEGKVGACEGEFTLTDGVGKFAGVSGSGKLKIRSPLRALVADLSSGALLRIGSGLAIITDLKYSIP